MSRNLLFLTVLMLAAATPAAGQLQQPGPGLSPERVVKIQLKSLQQNDVPTPDAGIEQTWLFAHPNNKRVSGPLSRFAAMIKGPNYRMLLGHRSFSLEPIVRTNDTAVFSVTAVTAGGQTVGFQWQVSKVESGEFAGAWMTVGVSPPLRAKDAI